MTTQEIIFNSTKDSYSFDRYSKKGWSDCIKYLLRARLSNEEIIAFMLSKHMRWAGDNDETKQYGELNVETLKKYLSQYPKYGTSEYIKNNLI